MPRSPGRRVGKALTMAVVVLVALVLGFGGGLQLLRYVNRPDSTAPPEQRQALYDLLRPVALRNCELERFGEARDGGYLMCANLLDRVEAGYSYGIGGYDKWGCDVATRRDVIVHQYDCFDLTEPRCATGRTVFHAECVGPSRATEEGRRFASFLDQFEANGDAGRRIVLKIDVEGAEWETFLAAPDEVLSQIDQLVVEFHWIETDVSVTVMERLRRFFEVVHVHFTNSSCIAGMTPFPAWAYEVTFVNKELADVDPSAQVERPHSLDARNYAYLMDCQP